MKFRQNKYPFWSTVNFPTTVDLCEPNSFHDIAPQNVNGFHFNIVNQIKRSHTKFIPRFKILNKTEFSTAPLRDSNFLGHNFFELSVCEILTLFLIMQTTCEVWYKYRYKVSIIFFASRVFVLIKTKLTINMHVCHLLSIYYIIRPGARNVGARYCDLHVGSLVPSFTSGS